MKRIVQGILASLARKTIQKHKPKVIAITGSVGKSTTKEAIYTVLSEKFNVGKSEGNLNNEFGVPLTVLGFEPPSSVLGWAIIVLKSICKVVFGRNYYDILVLEFGIDHPGDMVYLCKIAPPTIGVITAVERVHLEHFRDEGELAHEKEMLFNMLSDGSMAIANYDNTTTRAMTSRHKELEIITYGLNKRADVWAGDISVSLEGTSFTIHSNQKNNKTDKKKSALSTKQGTSASLTSVGKHQIYTVLPAYILGVHFGISPEKCAKRLEHIKILKGRMSILSGINGSTLLDSTYNAEPASMLATLDTLRTIPAKRKFAVLGDMLELGKASQEAHIEIAKKLNGIVSLAVLVGPEMLFAFNYLKNLPQNKLSSFHFNTAEEASKFIVEKVKAKPKDVKVKIEKSGARVSIKLLGLYADEAINTVDKFISDALVNGLHEVQVIHGTGGGVLSKIVSEYLQNHPKIEKFYRMPGNLGVTIIEL